MIGATSVSMKSRTRLTVARSFGSTTPTIGQKSPLMGGGEYSFLRAGAAAKLAIWDAPLPKRSIDAPAAAGIGSRSPGFVAARGLLSTLVLHWAKSVTAIRSRLSGQC